jgi:hypothetical protein
MRSSPNVVLATAFGTGDRPHESRQQRRLWLAFVVLGAALFLQQFVTLEKVKRLLLTMAPGDPVNVLGQKAARLVLASWRVYTAPADLAIAAVICLAGAYVVWAEVKSGTFSALLHRADSSERLTLSILALTAVVVTRSYLTPGQVFMGDAETHMLRSWMYAENIRHYQAPIWSNAWYGGFPLLANYGPLYFLVTALLTLALRDVHLATKLLLWSCHIVSIFTMFWFLREVTRRNLPALVGAVAYALSFHRLHILLYQGDLQLSVLFAAYPLLLLLVERYLRIRTNARITFVLVTATLATIILNHHGYAFFGLVLLAIYLVARLAVTPGSRREHFKILVFFGCAEVASLLVSSFLWAPFLFAIGEHRGMGSSAFPILIPNPAGLIMLGKLFRWSALSDGTSIGYVGVSIGVLAVIGGIHGIRHRAPAAVGLAACALASLLMVRNHVSYNIKNVDFFMLFMCALTAWAVIAVADGPTRYAFVERGRMQWGGRFPAHVAAICIGLLVIDLAPTTFQSVFRENYEFKQPMYQKLVALNGPYKVIERQVLIYDPTKSPAASFDPNKLGIPSAYAATQTPLGFFHEGAGLSFGYHAEIVKQLHRDLNEGRLSDVSAAGLYLLGVKHVIFRDRYRWFTPRLDPSPLFSVADGIVTLRYATPLLFSPRVIATSDVADYPSTDLMRARRYLEPETFDYSGRYFRTLVEPLIGAMRVDMTRGVAGALISRDGDIRGEVNVGDGLSAEILDFTTDLQRVAVRYRSNADAFGELSYNYFPYLRVDVDGTLVTFYRSAMNHILVRLPAGDHRVTVRGAMPPLQAQLLWFSLVAALGIVILPRRVFSSVDRSPA